MSATIHHLPVTTPHQDRDAINAAIGTCTRFRSLSEAAAASGRSLSAADLDALWDQACSPLPVPS